MCDANEKIISKIRKVLELSKNNPSENEAQAAALKAQKMMMEYHITMVDIDGVSDIEEITEIHCTVGTGNKWKSPLAYVIANNFRCKYFFYGKDCIVFYGYKTDAEIAAETFKSMFDFGKRKANNYYYKVRSNGLNTRGVKNAYLVGFLEGIKEVLEKQSTTLMVITPPEVEDAYRLKTSGAGFTTKKQSGLRLRIDDAGDRAKEEGRRVGKSLAQSRSIERKRA